MNLPTITDIKIKNSSGNKNSNTIFVSTREFNPNTHRIILRVNNKFYDDLIKYYLKDVVIDQGGTQSQLLRMNESLTIYAQLYDYKNDRIVCTKKKDFVKTLGSWELALGNNIINISNDYFNLFWNSNRKVVKVNGPFDKDGKLQAEVKPGERYYFTAEPNQKLHSVELLSAKWAYQYDDGNPELFKNHHETIKNGYSAMDCEFHADPRKIKVFAYFQERNENVMVEFSNSAKAEEVTPKNQQMEERPTIPSKEGEPKVENNEEYLVWSKKVSPEFCNKVIEICKNLWGEKRKIEMANGLMAVMAVETSQTFAAHQIMGKSLGNVNKITKNDFKQIIKVKNENTGQFEEKETSRAVGLIQFTQEALEQLGEFVEGSGFDKLNELKVKYAKMGEIKQLEKVRKYFEPMKEKIKYPEDIYLAVFAPTGIGKKDDFVLYKKGTNKYVANKSVDNQGNKDGKIQRSEILARYYMSFEEGKKNNLEKNKKDDKKYNSEKYNLYKIYIDEFKFEKIESKNKSGSFKYELYNNSKLIKTYDVIKNKYNLLPFPESGINWGRYGSRDDGGDNWINEKVFAALLGFFFSLPQNGYSGTLYYNDVSANNGRNIGHAGHKIGNDVDIRYPGSNNLAGEVLWSTAMKKYSKEDKFLVVLENILHIAQKWGFNKNYAYKKGIKYTTGVATNVHQNHFHIGLR